MRKTLTRQRQALALEGVGSVADLWMRTQEQARQRIDRVIAVGKHVLPEETISGLKEALAPDLKQLV